MNNANDIHAGRYRMSAQQCAIHVPDWQNRAPAHVLVMEIPGGDAAVQDLNDALDSQVRCAEILRTRYEKVAGLREPLQVVCPELPVARLALDTPANYQDVMDAACSLLNASSGPVVASVTCVSPAGHIYWAVAAISYNLDMVFLYGLMTSCLAHSRATDEEILQYPDYCAWQDDLRMTDVGRDGLRFWQGYAASSRELPRLPFELEGSDEYGQAQSLLLTETATLFIRRQAGLLGISEEQTLLSYWAGFVGRIAETATPSFDWLYDIRQQELEGTPGCLAMRLPLALTVDLALSPEALTSYVVAQLQDCVLWSECFDSGAYLDQLALTGKPRNRVVFSYLDARNSTYPVRGLRQHPATSQLNCLFVNTDQGILLQWQGSRAHSDAMVAAWMLQFQALVESAASAPGQAFGSLPMLDTATRNQLLAYDPFSLPSASPSLLHELFERSATEPASIAAICADRQLTYGQLEQQANALAAYLLGSGTRPGDLVGVYLGRSVDTLVALIAILKAGGAYLPLDPAYPLERIRYMLEDAGAPRMITQSESFALFADTGVELVDINQKDTHVAQENNAGTGTTPSINPASLAYVIYTSGSTGKPKGVMVSHANAVASTAARMAFYPGKVARFLLLSSFSFDSSVAGIFWTLGQGGTLYIPADDEYRDPVLLARLIEQNAVTHLLALPSFYSQILAALTNDARLECAIVAGEPCHPEIVAQHRGLVPSALLVNEYGPTEGTVWSNAFRIDPAVTGARIPIGRPVPGMRGYVLDQNLELCPQGVAGEWFISGNGITRGYLKRPGLTAQRFVADPFVAGERLYRTGDLARVRPDGEIEFLGRIDQQVKLRGYRIELGEIEALLMDRPEIREAVVVLQDDPNTGQHLAACILPAEGQLNHAAYPEQLTHYLRGHLPAFMVPARFLLVSEFPLMPNGKIDRNLLATTVVAQQQVAYVAPVTATEKVLADIWQNILQLERVGLADNFFNLGGHSLQGTQVAAQIRQRLSVDLPIRELFEIATLESLARLVESRQQHAVDELAVMDQLLADLEVAQ